MVIKHKRATVKNVVKVLDELARLSLALAWDNVGLLAGREDKEVKVMLMALDFSAEVLEQAIRAKADLIVTHHPAIFKPLKTLTADNWKTELLLRAIEHGIAVYSAHTNLDLALGGVNDVLADCLGLKNVEDLEGEDSSVTGIGRIGLSEKPMDLYQFAAQVKKDLGLDHVLIASAGKMVKKVAVCGGSGMDFVDAVIFSGADTFVTGDVKYHEAQDAVGKGLNIIDAGHQGTELPVINMWADRLALHFSKKEYDIKVLVAKESRLMKVM